MITTLTGANGFAIRSELDNLVAAFIASYGDIAVERLEGQEVEFDRIRESLQSTPFLADKKLVVITNASANQRFVEQAEKLLRELPETTDLILVEPTLDKRLTYAKFLKANSAFHELNELDENYLARWMIDLVKAKDGTLSSADARLLIERIGMNQQYLANEIEKLLLYNPQITQSSINLLTEQTPQSTIFELLDAAFSAHPEQAMAIYREQREQKIEPAQIIAMLTWQLRVMAIIKTAGDRSTEAIIKDSKLNPYTVRKCQKAASLISFVRLKQLITDLVAIDMRSKLENIDLDEALQLFLIKITS
jgi:DNA polymerase III delta subunit